MCISETLSGAPLRRLRPRRVGTPRRCSGTGDHEGKQRGVTILIRGGAGRGLAPSRYIKTIDSGVTVSQQKSEGSGLPDKKRGITPA